MRNDESSPGLEFVRGDSTQKRDRELIKKAQRLRYEVFFKELGKGNKRTISALLGLDKDIFDGVCEHILVVRNRGFLIGDEVIGTYRAQTGEIAGNNHGYYSSQGFDMSPFRKEETRKETIEVGRACIAKPDRSMGTLSLLWSGIAEYAKANHARYIVGCSSVDPDEERAASLYKSFQRKGILAPEEFRVYPRHPVDPELLEGRLVDGLNDEQILRTLPQLFRAYIDTAGAKICGAPSIDRNFGTIDFLTFLDLDNMNPKARERYLGTR